MTRSISGWRSLLWWRPRQWVIPALIVNTLLISFGLSVYYFSPSSPDLNVTSSSMLDTKFAAKPAVYAASTETNPKGPTEADDEGLQFVSPSLQKRDGDDGKGNPIDNPAGKLKIDWEAITPDLLYAEMLADENLQYEIKAGEEEDPDLYKLDNYTGFSGEVIALGDDLNEEVIPDSLLEMERNYVVEIPPGMEAEVPSEPLNDAR